MAAKKPSQPEQTPVLTVWSVQTIPSCDLCGDTEVTGVWAGVRDEYRHMCLECLTGYLEERIEEEPDASA